MTGQDVVNQWAKSWDSKLQTHGVLAKPHLLAEFLSLFFALLL